MKRRVKIRSLVVALCVAAGVIAGAWGTGLLRMPGTGNGEIVTVMIPRGTAFPQVTTLLEEKGLIRSRLTFRAMAWIQSAPQQIKAGEYEFPKTLTTWEILQKLVRGDTKKYTIIVPEGFTLRQIAARLAANGLADEQEFLRLARDRAMLASLNIPGPSAEGFLFPDTYIFDRTMDAAFMLKSMNGQFRARVSESLRKTVEERGLTLAKAVTLASIVEKETGRKDEMPLVAAVFLNRLRQQMPLQSDPTVIYGIEKFDGNLTRRDLQRQNPYNTYVNRGLPPGPICNPGLDALQAVLNPAPVRYLYFVSRNDGSHQFSDSLDDHSRAVRKYQINQKPQQN